MSGHQITVRGAHGEGVTLRCSCGAELDYSDCDLPYDDVVSATKEHLDEVAP